MVACDRGGDIGDLGGEVVVDRKLMEIKESGGETLQGYYDPNYKQKCEVCGQKPCVRIRRESGKVYYDGSMCGPCTWGDADALDPANW